MIKTMSPHQVKALLRDEAEYALVDVREEGDFYLRHLLLAVNSPLSRLELQFSALVPRRTTPIILVDDDGNGPALLAHERLVRFGYTDVFLLEGGVEGWAQAGYKVFSGIYVPSKAFGEFVEHQMDTPRLDPLVVKAMAESGKNMLFIDTRPNVEFRRMTIPGAVSVPGGDIVYRIADLVSDSEQTIIVNCAGRTRSIIGCQSLRNAGIPNPVYALKGGTMSWVLDGLELETGVTDRYDTSSPSAGALAKAQERAKAVAEKYGVEIIDSQTLETFRKERDTQNLYILDVRQLAEYAVSHLADAINVEGVTVVQSTDVCVGVHNGRVVLVDDTGVRAIMTASWLKQMGYPHVFVLQAGTEQAGSVVQGQGNTAIMGNPVGECVTLDVLQDALRTNASWTILDLGYSKVFRKGHIPSAVWGMRPYLHEARRRFPDAQTLVLVCDDGRVSLTACAEAQKAWPEARVVYLKGGSNAWREAGLACESGLGEPFSPVHDQYYRPYDLDKPATEQQQAMLQYLSWEEGLVEHVLADGDLQFSIQ